VVVAALATSTFANAFPTGPGVGFNSVSITSNNTNPAFARVGQTVTLTFSTSVPVNPPAVTIAGHAVAAALTSSVTNSYRSTYKLAAGDTEGVVPFEVDVTGTGGGSGSATSTTDASSVTFDKTAPPAPTITSPGAGTTYVTADPSITFNGNEAGDELQCKTSTTSFADCTSPFTVVASSGTLILYVRALDLAGNSSASVFRTFVVDPNPPTATSVSIASGYIANPAFARVGVVVALTFSADRAVQTPSVTIAGRAATVSTLNTQTHTYKATVTMASGDTEGLVPFSINLVSAAGVPAAGPFTSTTDASSVTFDKTPPPVPTITSSTTGPSGFTATFSSTEGLDTFGCRVDSGSFTTCSSPFTASPAPGSHTFQVHSVDEAGNLSAATSKPFSIVADGGAVIDLDFADDQAFANGSASSFTSLLTVSRAASGYAETSSGVWQAFGPNTLRITDKGLLSEHAKTNVVQWNRDLTHGVWQANDTITATGFNGIDGAPSASAIYTFVDGGTLVQPIHDGSRARFVTAFVERLSGSGPVSMTMDGVTWTPVNVTGSWTRVSIPTQTLANPTVGFQLGTAGDEIAVDFVQSENSALFASSPIYTQGAAVTRDADVVTLTDPSVTDITVGSWFAEVGEMAGYAAGGTRQVVSMRADASDKIMIALLNDNTLDAEALISNTVTTLASSVTVPADTRYRVAFAYQEDDLAAAFSANLGGQIATNTTTDVPTTGGAIGIGSNEGGQQLDGYIRHLEWLHSRVTNAGLQAWALQ
jgi:hypothetical protein